MDVPYTPTLALDATVLVTRYESTYPKDDPHSCVVGFSVTCNRNGKNTYSDIAIPYSDTQGKNEEEIVAVAWDRLEDNFQQWLQSIYERSSVVGTVFTPPNRTTEPAPSTNEGTTIP